jgi:hypothetical protein
MDKQKRTVKAKVAKTFIEVGPGSAGGVDTKAITTVDAMLSEPGNIVNQATVVGRASGVRRRNTIKTVARRPGEQGGIDTRL